MLAAAMVFCSLLLSPLQVEGGQLQRYVVVVDAGSTGTRAHVFSFGEHLHQKLPSWQEIGTNWTSPGLHTFVDSQNNGALEQYLETVISFSEALVPEHQRSKILLPLRNSDIVLGYRWNEADQRRTSSDDDYSNVHHKRVNQLYDVCQAENILSTCRNKLQDSSLLFRDSMARVISGAEEAKLAWIAATYLHGDWPPVQQTSSNTACKITSDETRESPDDDTCHFAPGGKHHRQPQMQRMTSTGILEMGGASMQVAISIPSQCSGARENLEKKNDFMRIETGNENSVVLYAKSYLGFGMRAAQKKFLKNMEMKNIASPCHDEDEESDINNDNLSKCSEEIEKELTGSISEVSFLKKCQVSLEVEQVRSKEPMDLIVYATENFQHVFRFFLGKKHPWDKASDSSNDTPWNGKAIGQSEINRFIENVNRFCEMNIKDAVNFYQGILARRLKRNCFAGAYILEVIEAVLGFDAIAGENMGTLKLIPTSTIDRTKLEWALGATVWATSGAEREVNLKWVEAGFGLD